MNLFLREIRAHLKGFLLWSGGMVLFVAASLAKFSGVGGNGQSMNDLMAEMPASLQAMMGTGSFDLSKISGYYGILLIYLLLLATLHAVMLGANIVAKEERDKTAEFLFVKPFSRSKVVSIKLLAALSNIVIFNLITLATCLLFTEMYGNGEDVSRDVYLTMVGMLILQLLFLSCGTAIAAMTKKHKSSGSLATGVLLFTFLLSLIIDLNDKISWLKYITPFKYFEAKAIMYGGGLDGLFVGLSILLIVVLMASTFWGFKQRDLQV